MFELVKGEMKPNEKMFQRISDDKLVIGTKYIFGDGYTGIYKGMCKHNDYTYCQFEKVYDHFEKKHFLEHIILILPIFNFYEFVYKQPQCNMEKRSVNMILRRLIGDDYFEW